MIRELAKSTIHSPFEVKDIYTKGAKCVRLKVPPQWQVTIQFSAFFFSWEKKTKKQMPGIKQVLRGRLHLWWGGRKKRKKNTPVHFQSILWLYELICIQGHWVLLWISCCQLRNEAWQSFTLRSLWSFYIHQAMLWGFSIKALCTRPSGVSTEHDTKSTQPGVHTTGNTVKSVTS